MKTETNPTCKDCGASEGTLSKEFDCEKSYSWGELADMTPVCACCGSENLEYQAKTETVIPFSGFYESEHSHILDSESEQMHDYDDPADDPAPGEEFSYTPALLNAYCKLYVEAFNDLLPGGKGLEYKSLHSPREYNFMTDQITCDITHDCINAMLAETNEKDLRDVIRERCTSYDGFISFYSNDRDQWPADVTAWDAVQLELLIVAYLRSTDQAVDDWELMESARCNGDINGLIDLGLPVRI